MGFKDFLSTKKNQAKQSYSNYKEEQKEKRDFESRMNDVERIERKESYQEERARLAVERGRTSGREQASKPKMRDKIVSGLMNTAKGTYHAGEEKGGFGSKFVSVNARSPRHASEQLNSNFRRHFDGSIHMDTDMHSTALNRAMMGGDNAMRGTALSKAFSFGGKKSRPRRHKRKK